MPIIGALAAIDVVFLALMGVGLLYITRQLWVPLLIWLLSQIPVIGGWVASQTGHWVDAAFHWIAARIAQLIQPLTDLIVRLTTRIRGFAQGVEDAFGAVNDALTRLRWVTLPAIEANLIRYIATVEQQLGRLLASQVLALQRAIALGLAEAEAYTRGSISAAVAAVNGLGGSLRDWVTALLASLVAWVGAQLQQQWAETQRAVHQAEATAAAADTAASDLARQGLDDLRSYLEGQIRGVGGLVGTLTVEAERYADLVNGRTLATALAATGVVELELEAIRRLPCIRACNPLGILGAELEALDLGLLLAVLVGAATHPKEGAQGLQSLLLPGGQQAQQELLSLFKG